MPKRNSPQKKKSPLAKHKENKPPKIMTQQQKIAVAKQMTKVAKKTIILSQRAGQPSTPQSTRSAQSTPRSIARGQRSRTNPSTPVSAQTSAQNPLTPNRPQTPSTNTQTISQTNQNALNCNKAIAPPSSAPNNLHAVQFINPNPPASTFDLPSWPEVDERDDHTPYAWMEKVTHSAYEAKNEQIIREYFPIVVGETGSALVTKKGGGFSIRMTSSNDDFKAMPTVLSNDCFIFNEAGVIIKGAIMSVKLYHSYFPLVLIKQFGQNKTDLPVRPIPKHDQILDIPNCFRAFPFAPVIITDDKDSVQEIRNEIAQTQAMFDEMHSLDPYAFFKLTQIMKDKPYAKDLKQSFTNARKKAKQRIMEMASPIDFRIHQVRHDLNLKEIIEMSLEKKKKIEKDIINSLGPLEEPDNDATMANNNPSISNNPTSLSSSSNLNSSLSQNHSHHSPSPTFNKPTPSQQHLDMVKAFHVKSQNEDQKDDDLARAKLSDLMNDKVMVGGNEVKKSRLPRPLFHKPDPTLRWKPWNEGQRFQAGRRGRDVTKITQKAPTLEGKEWNCEAIAGALMENILMMRGQIRERMINIYKSMEKEIKVLASKSTLFADVGGGTLVLALGLNGKVKVGSVFGSYGFDKRIAVIPCPPYTEEFMTNSCLQSGVPPEIAIFRVYQSTRRLEGIVGIGFEVARTPPCIDSEFGSVTIDVGSNVKLHKGLNSSLFWPNHPEDPSTEFHSNILETDPKDRIIKFATTKVLTYKHCTPQTNGPLERLYFNEGSEAHKRYGYTISTMEIQIGKLLSDEQQVFHMTAFKSWKQSIVNQPLRREKRAKKAALRASWN